MPDFGTYDGRPVRKSSLTIRGTGDGLSDALSIEPQTFSPLDTAYVVLEVEMSDVDHKYMKDADAWNRVQVCKAVRGAFIEQSIAQPILDNIAVAFAELKDEESGAQTLGLEGEKAAGRLTEHEQGLHRRKRRDCPLCFPSSDEEIARADELAARRNAHGDGEGDAENPTRPATRRRSKPGAPKTPRTRKK